MSKDYCYPPATEEDMYESIKQSDLAVIKARQEPLVESLSDSLDRALRLLKDVSYSDTRDNNAQHAIENAQESLNGILNGWEL